MAERIDLFDNEKVSILVEETKSMERARRLKEQQGLRALIQARVLAREHPDSPAQEFGEGYESEMLQHPLLDGQHLDGVDNNPADPSLSPQAVEKHKEIQRKQKAEKQLKLELNPAYQNRLTNNPTFTPRFSPKPGGP
jgi:hypothetical protein